MKNSIFNNINNSKNSNFNENDLSSNLVQNDDLIENSDNKNELNLNIEKEYKEYNNEDLIKKIKEYENLEKINLDKILRLKAELENIYKRNIVETEKVYKFSLEKFFINFLPIIDNLERTEFELNKSNIDINIIKEGINLIIKMLIKTIEKFNVKIINEINIPFNPNIHQAVLTINNSNYKNNYIISIMQKGYLLHDRLIRPAMVQVSLNEDKE